MRFVNDDGSVGYYAPDGKPMRKAFLRAPVEFTRVSSGFNPHRLHPILNLIRGHMGTDYAAPIGTPVHAAGDGRVSFKGERGGYGNAHRAVPWRQRLDALWPHVAVRRDIRVGSHVQQGEVIGYVGMSGLATGPHLHYEYLMNGVHKNPQTVRLPGAEPLQADAMSKFRAVSAPLLASLSSPGAAETQAAASSAAAPPGAADGAGAEFAGAARLPKPRRAVTHVGRLTS